MEINEQYQKEIKDFQETYQLIEMQYQESLDKIDKENLAYVNLQDKYFLKIDEIENLNQLVEVKEKEISILRKQNNNLSKELCELKTNVDENVFQRTQVLKEKLYQKEKQLELVNENQTKSSNNGIHLDDHKLQTTSVTFLIRKSIANPSTVKKPIKQRISSNRKSSLCSSNLVPLSFQDDTSFHSYSGNISIQEMETNVFV